MMKAKAICTTIICLVCIKAFVSAQTNKKENEAQNDWANLNYYKTDNAQASDKYSTENRIVFMGNSITEFWAHVDSSFFLTHKNFIDRGISGQTTPQMLLRFRQDVINLKPAVVVILGGTNDIAGNTGTTTNDEVFANLVSMYELAKANNIKVIVSSVLPAYAFPWKPELKPVERIMDLNKRLKEYATAHQLEYADYFTPMADERNGLPLKYSADGVHPNKEGYAVMNKVVLEAIDKTLRIK